MVKKTFLEIDSNKKTIYLRIIGSKKFIQITFFIYVFKHTFLYSNEFSIRLKLVTGKSHLMQKGTVLKVSFLNIKFFSVLVLLNLI